MDKKPCSQCKNEYEATQLFACDSCKKFLCSGEKCGNLTGSEIKCLQLKTKRKLIFLCNECEGGFWKVPALINEINELKVVVNKFLERANHTESGGEAAYVCNNDNIEKSEEILMEMIERQKRESNIMVANIKESKLNSTEQRKEEDLNVVKTVLQNFNIDLTNITAFRVGKLVPDKNRLLKVILKNREDAKLVLKHRDTIAAHIKIFGDQTKKQRDYYLYVKNKLQSLIEQGDNSKTIRFINNKPTIISKNKMPTQKNH